MWDLLLLSKALVMGIVEGLTEFLPISSTGHLIVAGSLLNFTDEKAKIFEIVIQIAAILAVITEYKQRVLSTLFGLGRDPVANRFAINVILAFMPLAVLGLMFGKHIKAVLFAPIPVAVAFIVGGFLILWIEKYVQRPGHQIKMQTIDEMQPKDAIKLGFIQALALIPGTSRSGATILGGLWMGLSRVAAAQFSFFLAMPTLLAAGVYELYKNRHILSAADLPLFAVGSVASFVSALLCVRLLLRYITTHDFKVFAYYRIVFGLIILITAQAGWVVWS